MDIYIYIDESGSFDEKLMGGASSVVGGICSKLSPNEWENVHLDHLTAWNERELISFLYPNHYHCGPLLSRKLSGPVRASDRDLRLFVENVFGNVLRHSLFGFISKNRGKRFEYSPQATYVMNLVASLRCAFENLHSHCTQGVERVTVVIAQRTIDETVKASAGSRYMTSLLSYLNDQLLVGEGPGVTLARQLTNSRALVFESGLGDRDAGLIAADFVCCLSRQGQKPPEGTSFHVCQPNSEMLLGDYRRFHERLENEMLQNHYYGSCLEFIFKNFPLIRGAPETSLLLQKIEGETDITVLEREVPALLAVVHQLSKNRTEAPSMLACVTSVTEKLVTIAERRSTETSPGVAQQIWLNLTIQALAELAACHNHSGSVGPQQEAEAKITALLTHYKGGSGLDALERKTFILEVRNRNLNLLFNDFRFDDAFSQAEELVTLRKAMIGDEEPDELLGQMLGSQGQACAFMGRVDPSWNALAVELFTQSLKHFPSGSRHEEMSQNFLVTVLWQSGEFKKAARELPAITGWSLHENTMIESLCTRLLLPQSEKRVYDIVNCLRIIASLLHENHVCNDLIATLKTLEELAHRNGTDHPYELLWKWIGVIYLLTGKPAEASRSFKEGQLICGRHSFTMKVIGISLAFLDVVAMVRMQTGDNQKYLSETAVWLSDLRRQSSGLDSYLCEMSPGIIINDFIVCACVDFGKILFLCRLLPFSYA